MNDAFRRIGQKKALEQIELLLRTVRPSGWRHLMDTLNKKGGSFVIAEDGGQVVGCAPFVEGPTSTALGDVVVYASYRRQGFGRGMVRWLQDRCSTKCITVVSEREKVGQLFLQALGFRGGLVRGHFGEDDGIAFLWRPTHPFPVVAEAATEEVPAS